NFAQCSAGRLDDFANAKAAADLNEFAARNNYLGFCFDEMLDDQDQRGCAIVYDRGGFRAAKNSEGVLDVIAAMTPLAGCQIVFEIRVTGAGFNQRANGLARERGASEICVNDNAGAVDHRLNSAGPERFERTPNKTDNRLEVRDLV